MFPPFPFSTLRMFSRRSRIDSTHFWTLFSSLLPSALTSSRYSLAVFVSSSSFCSAFFISLQQSSAACRKPLIDTDNSPFSASASAFNAGAAEAISPSRMRSCSIFASNSWSSSTHSDGSAFRSSLIINSISAISWVTSAESANAFHKVSRFCSMVSKYFSASASHAASPAMGSKSADNPSLSSSASSSTLRRPSPPSCTACRRFNIVSSKASEKPRMLSFNISSVFFPYSTL